MNDFSPETLAYATGVAVARTHAPVRQQGLYRLPEHIDGVLHPTLHAIDAHIKETKPA